MRNNKSGLKDKIERNKWVTEGALLVMGIAHDIIEARKVITHEDLYSNIIDKIATLKMPIHQRED